MLHNAGSTLLSFTKGFLDRGKIGGGIFIVLHIDPGGGGGVQGTKYIHTWVFCEGEKKSGNFSSDSLSSFFFSLSLFFLNFLQGENEGSISLIPSTSPSFSPK